VTDAFTPSRAFTQLKLPKPGLKSVCTVASIEGAHRILVATSEGLLYVGSIDPREGGECKITKEFGLVGECYHDEDSSATSASAGLTSQASYTSRQQTYASVISQGHTPPESHGGHLIQPSDSHDQRRYNLAEEGEEEDEQPPSAHTVQS